MDDLRLALREAALGKARVAYGASTDTLYAQAQMKRIADRSSSDPARALHEAKNAAALYITEGQTTQELSWFLLVLAKEGVKVALNHALLQLNLPDVRSPKELLRSPVWQRVRQEFVPIRRAWGMIGLFWALLLDQLQDGTEFRACLRCGRTIRGKRGKQF